MVNGKKMTIIIELLNSISFFSTVLFMFLVGIIVGTCNGVSILPKLRKKKQLQFQLKYVSNQNRFYYLNSIDKINMDLNKSLCRVSKCNRNFTVVMILALVVLIAKVIVELTIN